MQVRLCLSTATFGKAFTVIFLCFVVFSYIHQQNHLISTVYDLSDASNSLSDSERGFMEQRASTSLRSCSLRQNQTLTFPKAPHFIIIGAQKCGTSTLSQYLAQHPNLIGSNSSRDKELHFLDWNIPSKKQDRVTKQFEMNVTEDGLWCFYGEEYANRFDTHLLRKNSAILAFEKTPSYMFHGYYLPEILQRVCPWKPKLIAILRNPIDRAWSQYNMDIYTNKKLRESSSFESVLENEIDTLTALRLSKAPRLSDKDWNSSSFDVPYLPEAETLSAHKLHFRRIFLRNYLQRGMYAFQLKRWKDVFG